MLYSLFDYLQESVNFPGAGVFQYLSFRASMAFISSLLITIFVGKRIINVLRKNQLGEDIRELGLAGQVEKKGTPTMGGLIIIAGILIPVFLFADLTNVYVQLLITTVIWLGFIGGIDDYRKKKYKNAKIVAERISLKNKFAPEALYIAGSSRELMNDLSRAKDRFNKCIKISKDFMGNSKKEKLKRYYSVINESCVIHNARILYKQKQYKKSVEMYNSIPKASYRWPYTLIEKAWANYYLEDFNRSLGLVVTYKSPLLSSYFFPEAEVLNALSYYRLCLYKDTLSTIDQYYKVYKTRSLKTKN